MSALRTCAYCGSSGPLTREHLWPAGIIARSTVNLSYIGKLEKYVDAELTIKDVCAACNNGPLSSLDAYACSLYEAQFLRQALKRESRNFIYEYSTLLRWLLKMSYNTARANNSDGAVLSKFAPYVLGGGPSPVNVQVRLELIHPSKNPHWSPGTDTMQEIPAATIRCAKIEMPADPLPGTTARLVAINSYYFWVTITPPGADIRRLHAGLPGKLLPPDKSRISLHPTRGMLELHATWLSNPRANSSIRALRGGSGA